jgi:predicted RNase H-like nuclease (RuvC/YqgF family)
MVSQLKLTDFWNEPPQRDKKEGREETYNRVATSESISQMIELTKPMMSLQTTSMWIILSERLTRLETRLETLENEFRSFKRRVKADIRRRRTYLSVVFVSNVVSLLLKLLRVVKDWILFIR